VNEIKFLKLERLKDKKIIELYPSEILYSIKGIQIKRTQFACSCGFAISSHRCQGHTLQKTLIDLRPFKKINSGQVYVCLSRVKTIKDLFILNELKSENIFVDPKINSEMLRLRKEKI
jgi:ATP-dependent exoDNAse (exonuclease V) alpha subunit